MLVSLPDSSRHAIRSTIPEPQRPRGFSSSMVRNSRSSPRTLLLKTVLRDRRRRGYPASPASQVANPINCARLARSSAADATSLEGGAACRRSHPQGLRHPTGQSRNLCQSRSKVCPVPFPTSLVAKTPAKRSEPTKPARGGMTSMTASG